MEKQLKQSVKNASKQKTATLLSHRENLQNIIEEAITTVVSQEEKTCKR